MGVFKFLKNVGSKIFKKKDKVEEQVTNAPEPMIFSPDHMDRMKEEELMTLIGSFNLPTDCIEVSVKDDVVSISGDCATQEVREKIILAMGNVEGIAEVHDNITVEAAEPEAVFYEVAKGDTLWKISSHHYGKGAKYMVIFEANKPMLSDPDKIYPGQVLRIPSIEGVA